MMIELMLVDRARCPRSSRTWPPSSASPSSGSRPATRSASYCGLCIRMCDEQMDARAIGFQNRGYKRKISTPFDMQVRRSAGCAAPACTSARPAPLRCGGPNADTDICNACLQVEPTCLEHYGELTCWMYDAGRCGTCVQEKKPS